MKVGRQKSMSAAPASGSTTMIPAVVVSQPPSGSKNSSYGRQSSVQKSPQEQKQVFVNSEESDRQRFENVFDGALSSASRLSQIKQSKADGDLIEGIELMAPTQAYRSAVNPKVVNSGAAGARKQRVQAIDLNKDEGVQRDELLMMDLVGMDTGGN